MLFLLMFLWIAILATFISALRNVVYDVPYVVRGDWVDKEVLFINLCTLLVTGVGVICGFSDIVVPFMEMFGV